MATTTTRRSRPTGRTSQPEDDQGYGADKNGDFADAGDRRPGTGVDNNKDGDFDDEASLAQVAEYPPGTGKGDTIMVQRGNEFFVKNDRRWYR